MSEFKVEAREEGEKNKRVYLRVTHNGCQWCSIPIIDVDTEIPLIIKALQDYQENKKEIR